MSAAEIEEAVKSATNGLRTTVITCTVTVSLFMAGVIFNLGKWREQSEISAKWIDKSEPVITQSSKDIAVIKSTLNIR